MTDGSGGGIDRRQVLGGAGALLAAAAAAPRAAAGEAPDWDRIRATYDVSRDLVNLENGYWA